MKFVATLALIVAVLSANVASASSKDKFPLVWLCLGLTVVGIIIALYVAYRRPDELHLPGSTVMTAQETEGPEMADSHKNYNNVDV